MSQCTLEHYYEVIPNNKTEVAKCLLSLADCDCDFNGDNGFEYLWEEAEGFESNAEYCVSVSKNQATPAEMVKKFISMWMEHDSYYYGYDLGVIVKDNMLFVSLAYETRV